MCIIRSYGQTDNFQKIQFGYKEERLKAWEQDNLRFGDRKESIKKLKKELGIKEDESKNKLSAEDVLLKRISNIETLLSNENFLKKVTKEVLEIKKNELNKLKDELISLNR